MKSKKPSQKILIKKKKKFVIVAVGLTATKCFFFFKKQKIKVAIQDPLNKIKTKKSGPQLLTTPSHRRNFFRKGLIQAEISEGVLDMREDLANF